MKNLLREVVRGIVVKDNKLLVLKRNNCGRKYHVIPGGGIENRESMEDAVEREIYEETMIRVKPIRLLYIYTSKRFRVNVFIYLCEYLNGKPQLLPGSDEFKQNQEGKNLYQPKWLPLETVGEIDLFPAEVIERLVIDLKKGFDENVQKIKDAYDK
ncbi:NUDIX hydrolase [Candidatus Saccharibacteria bacterium CPR2]|nr:NUDIX hydrolase [Candidatus Saccharibacteria bacterium CPR2]